VKSYPSEIEQEMKKFYQTLSEKDKRRYAAVEALKLGHGGIVYLARVLGCHRSTINTGMAELKRLPEDSGHEQRIRKSGGGRKPYAETWPEIDAKFLDVISEHTAGDPMDETARWTNLSPREIADRLAQQHGLEVSVTVTRKLLDKHGYRRRKIQKNDHERDPTP
jgi:IS30 family transposase